MNIYISIQQEQEIYKCTYSFFVFFLLLYNSSSRAPLTEKNFLSISRVFTNKAERRIPEERPNFGLV